jgi:hypothetical protein
MNARTWLRTGVPEPYLDAWARLQCQKPAHVTVEQWRQAIDDAGRFLAQWGKLADSFGWTPGDLFDVPRDGAMGPAYDRVTRREWVNPYSRPVRPVILEHQQRIMQRVLGR